MARRRHSRSSGLSPWWLLIGGLALVVFQGGTGAMPAWGRQAPLDWWFNPLTLELRYAPGLTPPAPNFRPASAWEQVVYGL